jgi:hypothetical protein
MRQLWLTVILALAGCSSSGLDLGDGGAADRSISSDLAGADFAGADLAAARPDFSGVDLAGVSCVTACSQCTTGGACCPGAPNGGCCHTGEWCDNGTCRCGGGNTCDPGYTCRSGLVQPHGCGSVCCGPGHPCPF